MLIPDAFCLLGRRFEIHWKKKLHKKHDAIGMTYYSRGEIHLQENTPSYHQAEDRLAQTFCHELVHCLFFAIGEEKLGLDEKLVDALGCALHNALVTFEYSEPLEEDDDDAFQES